jgi:shikimate kinase
MTKNLPNKIYLIGFMASGKTTLGKKLSKFLDYTFVDTDKFIEEAVGEEISTIFKEKGEAYFRSVEHEALEVVTNSSNNIVVSTGGGMACNQTSLDYMLANGKVVILKLDLKSIKNRLQATKTKRPLLANLTGKEFNKLVDDLYAKRISFYEQAHLSINALNIRSISMDELTNLLINE